ncbi:hypothetical protein BKA65DRAFT_598333 [Rhexocercosporidium sp. MPI-PUGE-AT-0058]|nr:hypothetical protein BKA65DRAFT_598333 [Rhexocercosporidium sp. MPI-PUGE-AT-0058]
MAYTPQTPVHLTFDGEFAEDTPINSADMSPQVSTKSVKANPLSQKQRLQQTFASLYDDDDLIDLESPGWSSAQDRQDRVINFAIENVESFEVKSEDVGTLMEIPPGNDVETSVGAESEIREIFNIRAEWMGTSQFYAEPLLELQNNGGLDQVIAYREAVARDTACFPYDPVPLLTLSNTYGRLGFSDIAAGNAHRVIILIEAAMRITTTIPTGKPRNFPAAAYPQLDSLANSLIHTRYSGFGPHALEEELQNLHRLALQTLLVALLSTASNWEGLIIVKSALKVYPQDLELKDLQDELKTAFLDRSRGYEELRHQMKKEDLVEATRMGKIFQKKYPWMDQDLYKRTPETLREANKCFPVSNCELKAVVFGDAKPTVAQEGEDVGPLGIFATHDIEEGELVMVDKTITGVANVPSSKLEQCDACQGCLSPPYMRPEKLFHVSCCSKVAYCSLECYKLASEGYHKVLCGQDFEWLYNQIRKSHVSGAGSHWKPLSFLRIVAVVLADMRKSKRKIHPLRHPLLARMSANYPPDAKIMAQCDTSHSWQYFTNVVAPTQILLQLGVNVYTDTVWTQEVIQTIYWRIENNANMATTNLTGKEVHLVNINPNYLFFNHSCEPNISWHGACPSGDVGIDWLMTPQGDLLQPGCTAVWCIAARDIKKGEELKISYVSNPKGDEDAGSGNGREGKRAWLSKWFDNGCGCTICEEENRVEHSKANMVAEHQANMDCEMGGVVDTQS